MPQIKNITIHIIQIFSKFQTTNKNVNNLLTISVCCFWFLGDTIAVS